MHTVTNYEEFLPVISKTKLLNNIPVEHYPRVFQFLEATVRFYEKDEFIQRLGEPLLYSGIVLDGTIEGSFISESYNKINMNHFHTGRSFAESLACVQTSHSPIQLKALTNCTVMLLNLKQILSDSKCDCSHQQTLSVNLIKILASQNVFSNLKLRIANQKVLRDRILIYLHSLIPDSNGYIHVPFTQTALAEFLGVNRSALSRELGNMQNEELISVDGKKIKLLF
ncbi:transcriptional regulator, Crp/Fnr family [Lachnospiraceae bacterium TWA4]|nr:transcriptional regulator, Crp/Fnr family [Lachnospiraceae bacterium TWA4]